MKFYLCFASIVVVSLTIPEARPEENSDGNNYDGINYEANTAYSSGDSNIFQNIQHDTISGDNMGSIGGINNSNAPTASGSGEQTPPSGSGSTPHPRRYRKPTDRNPRENKGLHFESNYANANGNTTIMQNIAHSSIDGDNYGNLTGIRNTPNRRVGKSR